MFQKIPPEIAIELQGAAVDVENGQKDNVQQDAYQGSIGKLF